MRHLRGTEKNKQDVSAKKKEKKKHISTTSDKNNGKRDNQDHIASNEISIEEIDEDKENADDHF